MNNLKKICLVILWIFSACQVLTIILSFYIVFTQMMTPTYHGGIPDFVVFWSAGKLALQGLATQAYNIDILKAIEQSVFPGMSDGHMLPMLNPPVFFFYIMPFAALPYQYGSVLWILLPSIIYGILLSKIAPKHLIFPAIFCIWPYFNTATLGQSAILHTALWAAFTLSMLHNKKWLAGIFLGFLIYKPQMGILIPIALIAGKEWRTFLSATLVGSLLILLSLVVFGQETWSAFFENSFSFVNSMYVYTTQTHVEPHWFYGVFGLTRFIGLSSHMAMILHWLSVIIFAGILIYVWLQKFIPYELKLSVLILFSVFSSYYVISYDLLALIVPGALLVRTADKQRFYKFEPLAYLVAIFSGYIVYSIKIPALFIAWIILACLVFYRIRDIKTEHRHKPENLPF